MSNVIGHKAGQGSMDLSPLQLWNLIGRQVALVVSPRQEPFAVFDSCNIRYPVQESHSHAIRLSAMRENVISEEAAMIFGDSSGVHRVESHFYCNSVPFGMALMRLSDQ